MSRHDRAIAAFGQSEGSEAWAVDANEVSWRLRRSLLTAFQAREAGFEDAAAFYEREAAVYNRQHADLVKRMATMIADYVPAKLSS